MSMDGTECYRCGYELEGCHKRCPNCGSVNYCRDSYQADHFY